MSLKKLGCYLFLLTLPTLLLATDAQKLELSTYYPSPSGIFKNLRVSGNAFVATAGGNLGVGTTSPQFKLDVGGSTQSARIGQAETGAWPANTGYAFWGHEALNHTNIANYALRQHPNGTTYLNASPGKPVEFRIGDDTRMSLSFDTNYSAAPYLGIGPSALNKPVALGLQGNQTSAGTAGVIAFYNAALAGDSRIAQINADRENANDAGSLSFYTRKAGTGSLSKRLWLSNLGRLVLYNQDDSSLLYTLQSWKTTSTGEFGGNETHNYFSIDPGFAPNATNAFVIEKITETNIKLIRMGVNFVTIAGMLYTADGAVHQPSDMAESLPASDKNLEPGDVVALSKKVADVVLTKDDPERLDPEKLAGLEKTNNAYAQAIGVISTKPGILLSGNLKNSQPLALAGRVPTKVTLENGPIEPGNRLTSSSTPGYAMKATKAGHTVGIALEPFGPSASLGAQGKPFDGKKNKTGKIMVLIQPGWWPGDTQEELVNLREENEKLKLRLDKLERKLAGVRP